ncbi:MAG: type 1 glutamine amidotransferase [Paucimonas sp.]|jgi:protease I|nr:type 1 glutamine amidotransferase [Paucimonas sp.]
MNTDDVAINGLQIAVLVTDGFEQSELEGPKEALEQGGAIVKIVSLNPGSVQGMQHGEPDASFTVDQIFADADANEFDGILVPGGPINAGRIRDIPEAQQIVRDIERQGKPIAVICHGAWLLISAGLVNGRRLTSWPELQNDIRSAGGNWVDEEVVVDGNWISSRKPEDIPAFNGKLVEVLSRRMADNLRDKADGNAVGIASS